MGVRPTSASSRPSSISPSSRRCCGVPGGITFEQIHSLVPEVDRSHGAGDGVEAQSAPGHMTRHYAPRAELTLYEGPSDAVVDACGATSGP